METNINLTKNLKFNSEAGVNPNKERLKITRRIFKCVYLIFEHGF